MTNKESLLLASLPSQFCQILSAVAADLVEFPVELGRFVVLSLRRILAEEEDQPAVVDVKRVVVSVHLCRAEEERSGDELKVQSTSQNGHAYPLQKYIIISHL